MDGGGFGGDRGGFGGRGHGGVRGRGGPMRARGGHGRDGPYPTPPSYMRDVQTSWRGGRGGGGGPMRGPDPYARLVFFAPFFSLLFL